MSIILRVDKEQAASVKHSDRFKVTFRDNAFDAALTRYLHNMSKETDHLILCYDSLDKIIKVITEELSEDYKLVKAADSPEGLSLARSYMFTSDDNVRKAFPDATAFAFLGEHSELLLLSDPPFNVTKTLLAKMIPNSDRRTLQRRGLLVKKEDTIKRISKNLFWKNMWNRFGKDHSYLVCGSTLVGTPEYIANGLLDCCTKLATLDAEEYMFHTDYSDVKLPLSVEELKATVLGADPVQAREASHMLQVIGEVSHPNYQPGSVDQLTLWSSS